MALIIWWMFKCIVHETKIIKNIFVECHKEWILNLRFFSFYCTPMFQKQRIFIQNSKTYIKRNKLKWSWWIIAILINNEGIFNNKRSVYWYKNWMDIWNSKFCNEAKQLLKLQLNTKNWCFFRWSYQYIGLQIFLSNLQDSFDIL